MTFDRAAEAFLYGAYSYYKYAFTGPDTYWLYRTAAWYDPGESITLGECGEGNWEAVVARTPTVPTTYTGRATYGLSDGSTYDTVLHHNRLAATSQRTVRVVGDLILHQGGVTLPDAVGTKSFVSSKTSIPLGRITEPGETYVFRLSALDGPQADWELTLRALPPVLSDLAIDRRSARPEVVRRLDYRLDVGASMTAQILRGEQVVKTLARDLEVSEGTRSLSFDGSTAGATALADGEYTVRLTANNESTEPVTSQAPVVVDTRSPETTGLAGPSGRTRDTVAAVRFAADEADASFECRLDGIEWRRCADADRHTVSGLADGPHILEVRAVDAADNRDATPVEYRWVIDTRAPETSISGGPPAVTNTTATMTFAATEAATFECQIDGGPWAACVSPFTAPSLVDGDHNFAVRAVDEVGNIDGSPATRAWRLDIVAPRITITKAPSERTASDEVTVAFAVDETATFTCRFDDKPLEPCRSPVMLPFIAPGRHSFSVVATDAAGNTGLSRSVDFTVITRRQIASAIAPAQARVARALGRRSTSLKRGFLYELRVPLAGTARVTLEDRSGRRKVLATGRGKVVAPGRKVVRVRFNRAARKLLSTRRVRRVVLVTRYRADGVDVTVRKRTTIHPRA